MNAVLNRLGVYWDVGMIQAKSRMAYTAWFWASLFVQTVGLLVMVYFWSAVYENQDSIKGQSVQQTLNYIMLARMLSGLTGSGIIQRFGQLLNRGELAIELLRPVDFQFQNLAQALNRWFTDLLMRWQLWVIAIVFFHLQLPTEPLAYVYFLISLVLGCIIVFFFEWMIACIVFVTTESWGLNVLKEGVASFLSGALIPLTLMPDWLRTVAEFTPFSKAVFVPASFLSGLTPVSDGPRMLLELVLWVVGLCLLSRFIFAKMVKHATIQGG
ncbi:ABC transporter permease [Deinococcus cellulosilyticus]|uniref:Antibiotic ABC transporter permease n=1 Tax=Deinococcus cellulosilyticus (strain DSM 18568 / NBRC 106333 / KACC 11606 / 5516J-15) TaxID=1223518 RepID=A0A511MXU2_DEIC1|nr:ABC-2 family transporter protein [Deinococcus cellulosilyticus]GEM45390.1 antibiotic ABC transporter permease [Deinococcus cellulosilyticus NBRC 106333 = KACC 11606]